MLKIVATVYKKPSLSTKEFRDHWHENHAEIIQNTPDSAPAVRRYIQSPTVMEAYPDDEPLCDGITELWFDDVDAFNGWFDHDYYDEVVQPDEQRFVDMDRVEFVLGQEILIDANTTDTDMIKAFAFLKRRRGLTVQEFAQYWRWNHAPRVTSTPHFYEYIHHYVQNHPLHELNPGGSAYDGIATVWFSSLEEFGEWQELDDVSKVIEVDEEEFLDRDELEFLVTREVPVI